METEPEIIQSVPHSRESEDAVIGAIIIAAAETFHECRLELPDGGKEFYIHRNGWIYDAIERMINAGTPVDFITLSEELNKAGVLAEIGGPAYLMGLINATATSLNAAAYAKIVHDRYVRRNIINSANEQARLAFQYEQSIDEIASKATRNLSQAVNLNTGRNMISLEGSIAIVDRMIEENGKQKELPGIPTGWVDYDKLLGGGSQPGDLNIVSTRPGFGKTTFLMQLARNGARYTKGQYVYRKNVVIFSAEMPHEQLTMRLWASASGIDYQLLRAGRIPEHKFDDFYKAVDELSQLDILIDDTPAPTPAQIRSKCELLANAGKLDLIVVDSLNLMRSGLRFNSTHLEVDHNATELKNIAREFKVPVWAAHQMNRSIDSRDRESKPVLSDLREGGEQPSDGVMFIYHEKNEKGEVENSSFIQAKHRNGPTGEIPIVWLKNQTRFENAIRITIPN
jgi:replicative DNA helicase